MKKKKKGWNLTKKGKEIVELSKKLLPFVNKQLDNDGSIIGAIHKMQKKEFK